MVAHLNAIHEHVLSLLGIPDDPGDEDDDDQEDDHDDPDLIDEDAAKSLLAEIQELTELAASYGR